jgi:hypothetical protein
VARSADTGTPTATSDPEAIVAPTGIAEAAGVTLPAARPEAGGNIAGIALVRPSGDASTWDGAPASGRGAVDNVDNNDDGHPMAGTGTACHGGGAAPKSDSFMRFSISFVVNSTPRRQSAAHIT